jgi:fibronectin type 3 domain-containing protein
MATAQSSSSINVSWDAVSGAASYKVYYGTSSSSIDSLAGTATGASYTHTGLQANTTYYYCVKAVNSAGESDYSSSVSAKTSDSRGDETTAPSAPTGVTATAQSASSISVSWNAVSAAASYKVYYAIGSSTNKTLAGTVTGTSYSHTGLEAGMTYWYYIKAVNTAGESNYSSGKSATTSSSSSGETGSVPGAPTVTVSGSSTLTVTWTVPSGSPTSYDVYRTNRITGQSELLRENITTRSYIDNSPYPGSNLYGIRAKNSYGTGPSGIGYNSTPVPLATPTMGTISWGSGAQTLNILINPVTYATEYIVYSSDSASGTYSVLDTVDSDTMLAGKVNFSCYFPVTRGSTWYFKVMAVFETDHTSSRVVSSQSSYKSYKIP